MESLVSPSPEKVPIQGSNQSLKVQLSPWLWQVYVYKL